VSIFRNTRNSIIPSKVLGMNAGNVLNDSGFHRPRPIPAIRNNQKYFSIKALILICNNDLSASSDHAGKDIRFLRCTKGY
jgi:hypothetical protein